MLIERLATLGYVHRGDLGIPRREAFTAPAGSPPHHLYVCPADSLALRNHRVVRDRLRADDRLREEYGELKRRLAEAHPDDIDAYIAGRTEFLVAILREHGIAEESLDGIRRANLG